ADEQPARLRDDAHLGGHGLQKAFVELAAAKVLAEEIGVLDVVLSRGRLGEKQREQSREDHDRGPSQATPLFFVTVSPDESSAHRTMPPPTSPAPSRFP